MHMSHPNGMYSTLEAGCKLRTRFELGSVSTLAFSSSCVCVTSAESGLYTGDKISLSATAAAGRQSKQLDGEFEPLKHLRILGYSLTRYSIFGSSPRHHSIVAWVLRLILCRFLRASSLQRPQWTLWSWRRPSVSSAQVLQVLSVLRCY